LLRSGKKRSEGPREVDAGLLLRALVEMDRVDEVLVGRLQRFARPGFEVHEVETLFPGEDMRASTKGLSVHVGR